MDYRIEDLAARSGLRVDTIRYYQGKGLLLPPRREGRIALYDDAHLERLGRIRALVRDGLSLALIRRVLEAERHRSPDREPLLSALVAEQVGGRTLTRTELAAEAGIPEALIRAAQAAGLVAPIRVGDEERFGESDLQMARSALALLSAGIPLDALTDLAVQQARATQEIAERAIDLFDRHVRKGGAADADPEAITAAFRDLLPQATRLVALFFQRTIVSRALARLEGSGERSALQAAIAATESKRLEVAWK